MSDTNQNTIAMVAEFMLAAGQTIPNQPTEPSRETLKLRLALDLEELCELAQAAGLEFTFNQMMAERAGVKVDTNPLWSEQPSYDVDGVDGEYNEVGVLDALCDLRVVTDGAVLACGLNYVFPAAMGEVHRSNMSKFFTRREDAQDVANHFNVAGMKTSVHEANGVFSIKDDKTGKVLKAPGYSKADLGTVLNIHR